MDIQFGLGFMVRSDLVAIGGPGSFGHFGFGGSFGWADPEAELAMGYVMNLKGTETIDHAALEYSWMRPPSRSRRRTGPTWDALLAPPFGPIGVARARPRWGLPRW